MKTNIQTLVLAITCIAFSALQANAQNHKSFNSPANEILPVNRTAFLFCYNNGASYKNPAIAVLNNKPNQIAEKSIVSKNTIAEKHEENMCMFPNITEDELWVEVDNTKIQNQDLHLEIYNANGERVYDTKMEQNLHKINMCDFIAGTFLVKLGDSVQKIEIE